jgi:hypothetical protein
MEAASSSKISLSMHRAVCIEVPEDQSHKSGHNMQFEVFTVALLKTQVFWDVTACDSSWGASSFTQKMKAVTSQKTVTLNKVILCAT